MNEIKGKLRLDSMLVERGFFASRSRARDAILRSSVYLANQIATKPGILVDVDANIQVLDPAQNYVSRAALKLISGLDLFDLDVSNVIAADIGASTGGFTQVLLERGAKQVTAIDVGRGQMAGFLSSDKRVSFYEKLNARALTEQHFNHHGVIQRPNFIVSDVSFISLKLALPPVLNLAEYGARAVLLVKPQFEAGKENIGKGGLLKDLAQAQPIAEDLYQWLNTLPNWRALDLKPSPIKGGEGAEEFLLYGSKTN